MPPASGWQIQPLPRGAPAPRRFRRTPRQTRKQQTLRASGLVAPDRYFREPDWPAGPQSRLAIGRLVHRTRLGPLGRARLMPAGRCSPIPGKTVRSGKLRTDVLHFCRRQALAHDLRDGVAQSHASEFFLRHPLHLADIAASDCFSCERPAEEVDQHVVVLR